MKVIVISGINLFEGGPLSVYKDCLNTIIQNKLNKYNKFIIFVHRKDLFEEYKDEFEIIELPNSRKNYLYRLWYEYVFFYFYSRNKKIDIWLSLHDITPNVKSRKRYVYCHNASPFYEMSKFETRFAPRLKLFNLFYKYLYRINIKKNDYVIVQQNWIKENFVELFKIDRKKVLVAHPGIKINVESSSAGAKRRERKLFFYPSFPRVFKNFEIICEAVRILNRRGISNFDVVLTIRGNENEYAKYIVNKYSSIENITFSGLLTREKVFEYYNRSDCLIFPSKLETWGLPISEYKAFEKPIILANLEYAKETLGNYEKAYFFDPNRAEDLAEIIEKTVKEEINWETNKKRTVPDSKSWEELFNIIL